MNGKPLKIQELQAFINAIDAGVTVIDRTGKTILFNAKMEQITGYTLAEASQIEGLIYLLSPKSSQSLLETFTAGNQVSPSKGSQELSPRANNIGLIPTKYGTAKPLVLSTSSLKYNGQMFLVNTYKEVSHLHEREDFARLLESVVIHANDAILITEAEPFVEPGPRIVYANDAFAKMTGYGTEEILGQTPRILQGEKTNPAQKAKIRKGLENWEPVREELINYKKDGTEFWVELNIVPVADSSGWYTHWISIQRDITSQKILETALRDSQQQCKLAVVSGKMGLWDWDLMTQDIQLDPSLQEMMGVENVDLGNIVNGWSPLVHPDDLPQVFAAIEAHLNQVTPTFNVEYRMRHQKGEPLWVYTRGQAYWNEQGEPYRMMGLNADITERKQAEMALVKSEQSFRKIFIEAPIGITRFKSDGQLIQVNPVFCQMLGYSEQQLLSLNLEDITHPDDLKQEQVHTQKILTEEISIYQLEKRYVMQNHEILWAQVTRGKIQMQDDPTPVLIDMVQDITERHQIEKMKDDFLSIITHELRTPLTSLKGALGLLSTGKLGSLTEQGQRMLSFANTDADLLVRLISDMLDFDRLNSGALTLSPQTCLTQTLIDQVIQIVQPLATTANIQLSIDSVNIPILVDRDHIVQTLTNLLSNAIKFSNAGSTIWLKTTKYEDHVLFQVIDQGRGIPPEKLDRIFERFQQVDVSDSRRRGGVGLGLAICKSIVQQHGGKIWAESTLNVGSTFNFTLPLPVEHVTPKS